MQTPQVLDGRYRLQDRLGSGGMSVVWRAHDRILNRDVAVKVLDGPYAAGAVARERIRAEAQAAAGIWHPNVTNVFDYGEAIGEDSEIIPYVVMELMPGRTLADRLTSGPLPPRAALRICAQVASGLAAAHEIGLVHRDVKPGNVMLTPSGAKVFDFGIAALIGGPEVEYDGRMLGTPAYLAPERLTENIVIPASDVYALGLLLYRALTGELPWNAETSTQMFTAHIYLEPAPLPVIDGVDDAVKEVCARCLAKDPSLRPSATEVAAMLADAAGIVSFMWDDAPDVPVPAVLDAATGGPLPRPVPHTVEIGAAEPVPRSKRRRGALVLLAVLIAAISTGTVIAADRGGSAPGAGTGALRSPAFGAATGAPSSSSGGSSPGPKGAGPVPTSTAAGTARTAPATGGAPTFARPSVSPSARASAPATAPTRTTPATTAPPPIMPPPITPPPTPPASPPASSGGPVSAAGGTIQFTCTGNSAVIRSAAPNLGWIIGQYNPGPSVNVKVVFVMLLNKSEIDVHCNHGKATTKIK